MRFVKLAGADLNQIPFCWHNNKRNILNAIGEARALGVTVLCLPELSITGYGCEDDFFRPDLQKMAWNVLLEILPHTKGMIVTAGLPLLHKNKIYNCAVMIVNEKIAGFVAKKTLANDGVHYEARQFEAWPDGVVEHFEKDGCSYPLGDLYFRVDDLSIGFEICEEAWKGKREGAQLSVRAVDIIVNPSASHFSFSKMLIRRRLVLEGSRAFGVTYVYVNLLGNEAGRVVYDGGTMIAQGGKMLALGKRFSYQDYLLTTALVDVEFTRMTQSRTGSFKPEILEKTWENKERLDEQCITVSGFKFPPAGPELGSDCEMEEWETGDYIKEEEFTRSIALGLFDYLRKSRSNGFMVSLSGGADSGAVVCLVKLMVDLAVAELGIDGFRARLPHIKSLAGCKNNAEIVNHLLVCAYQRTAQSGSTTRNAAKKIAAALGARYFDFDIEPAVKLFVQIISKAIGRKLTWEEDDITLQNIQARARAPLAWMLANIFNQLLLSTSNRSEGAVGYCTMDGDTAGGLAPIAGIDKCFLLRWLRWLEKHGPSGFKCIPELSAITSQNPTAELRPAERSQTDEKDLMPYDILNAIEDEAIENNRSPLECYQLMRVRFSAFPADQVAAWVEKFFFRWSINQWKRERFAPALHCDTRNLDPRTWRRSPILSGRFELEINAMWEYAQVKDKVTRKSMNSLLNQNAVPVEPPVRRALIIVDPQLDFMPGGALPVPQGDSIVPAVNDLIASDYYDLVVATQDWHPYDHCSFAANHKGAGVDDTITLNGKSQRLWPVHCVQESPGAEFHQGLDQSKIARVFRKGMSKAVDSYSGFFDNDRANSTGLSEYLKENAITNVDVAGLALGYCVSWTALDAVDLGFKTRVIEDASAAIVSKNGDYEKCVRTLKDAGVEIITSRQCLPRCSTASASR